jgi:hypothetical protein
MKGVMAAESRKKTRRRRKSENDIKLWHISARQPCENINITKKYGGGVKKEGVYKTKKAKSALNAACMAKRR